MIKRHGSAKPHRFQGGGKPQTSLSDTPRHEPGGGRRRGRRQGEPDPVPLQLARPFAPRGVRTIGYCGDPWFRASVSAELQHLLVPAHLDDPQCLQRFDALFMHTQWPDDDVHGLKGEMHPRFTPRFRRFLRRAHEIGVPFVYWDTEGGDDAAANAFRVMHDFSAQTFSTATRNGYGCPALPFAASPTLFPARDPTSHCGKTIVFPGSLYVAAWPRRQAWLEEMREACVAAGWTLTVRAWWRKETWPPHWWPHIQPPVAYAEQGAAYLQHSVVASHNLIEGDATMCSLRLPVAAMSGTPVITNAGGLASSLSEAGGAIIASTRAEMVDALRQLEDPAEWSRRSGISQAWARASHTWQHRFDRVISELVRA